MYTSTDVILYLLSNHVLSHLMAVASQYGESSPLQSNHHHNHFTALFQDHPGEPLPEENFWTLWCKGRLTEAYTVTIRLGATPSGLTSAHLHHLPIFCMGRMPFLPPNQQCQSTAV